MADKKEHDIDSFIAYADKAGVKEDQATALFYAARGSVVKDTGGDPEKLTGEEFGMLWGKYKELIAGTKKKKESIIPEAIDTNSNNLYLIGLYDDMDDYGIYISVEKTGDTVSINTYTQDGDLMSSKDITHYNDNSWDAPNTEQIQDRLEQEVLQMIDTFAEPYTEEIYNSIGISLA